MKKIKLVLCGVLVSLWGTLAAQDVITGTITDENGEPLAGAIVQVQGSTRSVSTDIDGSFSISVKPADVLEISFLGYETQTITVGGQKKLAIQLAPKANELDEVVLVAFGKQKKESVIGSITTISPADLKVPNSNLTTAFAGQMAGVIAYQRSGEPGADDAVDFFVRGVTTFGGRRDPLILIDNIELTKTDLARLQPDDIASFSIMKDATATALYGARGANGVIFVTTKQGFEGAMSVSVRVENSFSSPTRMVELADPVTYMQLANEAVLTRNPRGSEIYTQEKIDNTISGRDPLRYPANDWMDMLIKDYATSQRYNLSISGGGKVARYYVSGGFNHDNGIMKVDKRQNFNNNISNNNYAVRSNIELRLTKTTNMSVRLSGTFDDYSGPLTGGDDMFRNILRSNPVLFPAYYPATEETKDVKHIMFGNKENRYYNPYAESIRGYRERDRSQLLAQVELNQKLDFVTEGLSLRGIFNTTRLSQFSINRFYNPFWYEMSGYNYNTGEYRLTNTNPADGTDWLGYSEEERAVNATVYAEVMANYSRTFGNHSVSGLLVGVLRSSLDAPAGTLEKSLPYRNLGLSGRFTYGYSNRYFFEFNFGYNGSERFAEKHRFGFFPSAGIAWNIANESFWALLKETVNLLKLRYSYGLVGNDQIGDASDRFYYISQMDMTSGSRGFTFGRDLTNHKDGIILTRDANPDITWEISRKQNYALEVGLWNDLTLIAEYFREKRTNILMDRNYMPTTMGLSYVAKANVGEASGWGVDLSLEYQKSWSKDFWTVARANFTYATSRYDVYEEPLYSEGWRLRAGKPISQQWGYIAERLFIDDAEAANSPRQEITAALYGGGDIKYSDVNGDGVITTADMVPIGLPTTPEIVYGFGFSTGYKGFDLSVFFQGLANESFWINTGTDVGNTVPFVNDTQLLQVYADSHWSEANRDLYALWPRLSIDRNENNLVSSTWFMRDGSFLRLKSLEIGYSLPKKLISRLHLSQLRIYFSGTNLLTFSKFKLWDVEMAGNGLGYPIQRVLNVGVNLTIN
ncbi:MAG: TonB-dependent receptor [Prevotellaceae bacterium]|jgi:TonB-linked SusC/RagA family outer membrane protein|nr:TonB-dependent receptor [Prevotellaceae bacterium]